MVLMCRWALGPIVPSLPVIWDMARGEMLVVPVILRTEIRAGSVTLFSVRSLNDSGYIVVTLITHCANGNDNTTAPAITAIVSVKIPNLI